VVKRWLHSTGDASSGAALLLDQILPGKRGFQKDVASAFRRTFEVRLRPDVEAMANLPQAQRSGTNCSVNSAAGCLVIAVAKSSAISLASGDRVATAL
jgi:hypothetical protein